MIHPDKQTNNKRIAINTMMLYIRMFIMLLVGLYTSRIIINTLGIQDYGLYEVVGGIVVMLSFINSSMSTSTSRFLTYELGKKDFDINSLKKIFHVSLTIHVFIAVLVLVLGETVGLWFVCNKIQMPPERLVAGICVYQSALFISIIMIINVPYNASIICHEKMGVFAYMGIIDAVLKVLILFLIPVLPYDNLISYSILLFFTQILVQCLYVAYCRRMFEEARFKLCTDKNRLKEILPFLCWNLAKEFANVSSSQGLNIILNLFFGPAVNAARGIMFQAQQAVAKSCINFQMAINPQIIKSCAAEDKERMQSLVYLSSRYSFFLLFIIVLPVWSEIESVLTWWLKEVPEYTASFIRIMMFEALLSVMSNPLNVAIISTGKIKRYQIVMTTLLLFVLPVSYLCLYWGGEPEIVFLINVVSAFISYILRLYFVYSMLRFSLKTYVNQVALRVFWPALISVLFVVLLHFLFQLYPNKTIIVFIGSLIISIISIFRCGITRSERDWIYRYCKINAFK